MPKKSAGLLVYHFNINNEMEVLLVHPGGPFFKHKDDGYWSIPKGEYTDGEDPLTVARREFTEETGNEMNAEKFELLGNVKLKSGKVITAWAVEKYFEMPFISSNNFDMKWPPKSGKITSFPETDNAAWFGLEEAKVKMYESQHLFLEALISLLNKK